MKKYRIDDELIKPDWWIDEDSYENQELKKVNKKNRIWVEEVVKIFGEIYYTEKYSLMSRNKLKKLKLWIERSKAPSILKKNIGFTSVFAFRS
ncbi:hypothetical protein [Dolichospermum circinale]|uniref:hypothetical protein n=1 Tax=Dolichospermum circinale TaxID=109265 RepID=UPI00232DB239|nr:hypothetical protein [Dolichospermum circinale]MDB9453734.1 hypothetical protein [Dolichospermum circinale CS-541/06]MDB9464593.1 hypothetical protein [Dolichospermum circinale CS-541/04]